MTKRIFLALIFASFLFTNTIAQTPSKFEKLYRSAKSTQSCIETRCSLAEFSRLIREWNLELSVITDAPQSEPDKKVIAEYAAAFLAATDAQTIWVVSIQSAVGGEITISRRHVTTGPNVAKLKEAGIVSGQWSDWMVARPEVEPFVKKYGLDVKVSSSNSSSKDASFLDDNFKSVRVGPIEQTREALELAWQPAVGKIWLDAQRHIDSAIVLSTAKPAEESERSRVEEIEAQIKRLTEELQRLKK